MKPLLQSWTPTQLLWTIAASNVLVVIGFGVLSLPSRHRNFHLLLWCSFVTLIFGLVSSLVVERALQNGINSERWPDGLLAVPRKLAAHPASAVLAGFLFIGVIAYVVFSSAHHFGGSWIFLWPLMILTRVQGYLRPKAKSDSLLQPLERPKSLQSEDWGAPPRPFTN